MAVDSTCCKLTLFIYSPAKEAEIFLSMNLDQLYLVKYRLLVTHVAFLHNREIKKKLNTVNMSRIAFQDLHSLPVYLGGCILLVLEVIFCPTM